MVAKGTRLPRAFSGPNRFRGRTYRSSGGRAFGNRWDTLGLPCSSSRMWINLSLPEWLHTDPEAQQVRCCFCPGKITSCHDHGRHCQGSADPCPVAGFSAWGLGFSSPISTRPLHFRHLRKHPRNVRKQHVRTIQHGQTTTQRQSRSSRGGRIHRDRPWGKKRQHIIKRRRRSCTDNYRGRSGSCQVGRGNYHHVSSTCGLLTNSRTQVLRCSRTSRRRSRPS